MKNSSSSTSSSTSPNALCFGSDLPAAGMACRVELFTERISVELPGAPPEQVPFTALTVEAGGFENDQMVLKWTRNSTDRRLYLKDAAVIVAFRRVAPASLSGAVERTAAGVRRVRRSRRALLGIGLGSVGAAVVAVWLGFDAIVAITVERIPIEWEQAIGDAARREFLENQTIVERGPAVDAVNEITHRLVQARPETAYRFQVTIVRHDAVNAFALPGGYIIVFTGLVKAMTGPDEVAGVLSHELNHVVLRHALKRVLKNVGLAGVVTIAVGDQQGMIRLLRRLVVELATLRFSREQEIEADLAGLRLLHQAKISPAGLIAFFERLSKGDHPAVELLSTHPMSTARAERLKREADALPSQSIVPFSFDWEAVQQSLR
jgi:Zn-dependent protease with chaperone function